MNPVLLLTHNNLALTKRCVESVFLQDIPTTLFIVENGSTDGSVEWLRANIPTDVEWHGFRLKTRLWNASNLGVSAGWNAALRHIFGCYPSDKEHCLVIGNDTWLPTSFYRTLLSCELPFVTGVAVDNMKQANENPEVYPLEPYPDFSAFLVRRECWEKVGPFDERMKLYASDCDFHVRAHRLGMPLYKASVPFYHQRSSTLNLAPPDEQQEILEQANKDRAVFQSLYGCLPGTPQYEALFKI